MLSVNDALTRDLITEILSRKGAIVVDLAKKEQYTVMAGDERVKLLILTMEDD